MERLSIVAGTRTAPSLTGAATYKQISVHMIDNSGDVKSDTYLVPIAATQAQIEAFVASLQLLTNASIYQVDVNTFYGSAALGDASNAVDNAEKSTSVFDALITTWKHTDPNYSTKRLIIPAPIEALFIGAGSGSVTDTVDGSNGDLATLFGDALAMFGAGWGVQWVRYVEKKEINERVRV